MTARRNDESVALVCVTQDTERSHENYISILYSMVIKNASYK
jgi:hypothetical protein